MVGRTTRVWQSFCGDVLPCAYSCLLRKPMLSYSYADLASLFEDFPLILAYYVRVEKGKGKRETRAINGRVFRGKLSSANYLRAARSSPDSVVDDQEPTTSSLPKRGDLTWNIVLMTLSPRSQCS